MRRILIFLKSNVPVKDEFLLIIKTVLFFLGYVLFLVNFKPELMYDRHNHIIMSPFVYDFYQNFWVVLSEEAVYRFMPIVLLTEYRDGVDWTIFPLIILTSTLFALEHGTYEVIFFEGFAGLLFSFLFIKLGGATKKRLKPFMVIVLLHVFLNFAFKNGYLGMNFLRF